MTNDGLSQPQRGWAMIAILAGILLASLDAAVANVALPAFTEVFGVKAADTVWVVNAYQLAMAVCILPAAALGDSLGYKRVYCIGLLLFTACSVACALAPSLPVLIAARALQGASGAALGSVSQALVRTIYPKRILGSGMSWYTLMVGVSFGLGPVVGSSILSVANWPWIFAINIPIGIGALAVATRMLPTIPGRARRFDWSGALLNAGFFILLITGLDKVGEQGAGTLAAIEIASGIAFAVALFRHQVSKEAALLPVDLFRIPVFALSSMTSICSYAAQTMALIALPFFLQDVLHRSQFEIGLLIAPWPLSVACVARLSGKMADRHPIGLLAGAGLGLMCIGLGLLAFMPSDASSWNMLWRVVICGFGFGFFQTPNNRAMMTAGPLYRSGAANGAMAASRLLGQSIGAAIAAIIFAIVPAHSTTGTFVAGAFISALGAVASLLRLATPAATTRESPAE